MPALQKGAATPHPGMCRHSLQYDSWPGWFLGEQVGIMNKGSVNEKAGKVCDELRKRMVDVFSLQLR